MLRLSTTAFYYTGKIILLRKRTKNMGTILEGLRSANLQKSIEKTEDTIRKPEEKKTLRGVYRCRVCGYIFDESLEGKPFSTLEQCPICKQGPGAFQQVR